MVESSIDRLKKREKKKEAQKERKKERKKEAIRESSTAINQSINQSINQLLSRTFPKLPCTPSPTPSLTHRDEPVGVAHGPLQDEKGVAGVEQAVGAEVRSHEGEGVGHAQQPAAPPPTTPQETAQEVPGQAERRHGRHGRQGRQRRQGPREDRGQGGERRREGAQRRQRRQGRQGRRWVRRQRRQRQQRQRHPFRRFDLRFIASSTGATTDADAAAAAAAAAVFRLVGFSTGRPPALSATNNSAQHANAAHTSYLARAAGEERSEEQQPRQQLRHAPSGGSVMPSHRCDSRWSPLGSMTMRCGKKCDVMMR